MSYSLLTTCQGRAGRGKHQYLPPAAIPAPVRVSPPSHPMIISCLTLPNTSGAYAYGPELRVVVLGFTCALIDTGTPRTGH